jgi:hypothetical protein
MDTVVEVLDLALPVFAVNLVEPLPDRVIVLAGVVLQLTSMVLALAFFALAGINSLLYPLQLPF